MFKWKKKTEIWWRIVVTSLWRLEWFNWAQGILGVKVPHKHKYTLVEMNISAKVRHTKTGTNIEIKYGTVFILWIW